MYLRVCFIARFGTALHFFYLPQFKTAIDSFSADKKIATRITSVFPNRKDFVRMFHAHRGLSVNKLILNAMNNKRTFSIRL